MGIKTIEEAQALPEKSLYDVVETHHHGDKVIRVPFFRDLVACSLEDTDILCFVDNDGRRMCIGFDRDGAYKYPS